MDRATIDIYEAEGARYSIRRGIEGPDQVTDFASSLPADGLRLDLGSGPGHYLPLLGSPAIALDGAHAMAAASLAAHPHVPAVQADVADLPFGRETFDGVWASKVLQHLPAVDLPMALADVRRVLTVGGRFSLRMFAGDDHETVSSADSGDDLPGRLFSWWTPDRLRDVVESAAFTIEHLEVDERADGHHRLTIEAVATRALPDHVGPGMRLLICGANPSLHSADAGVGYVSPSNRFWPAMAQAGLARRDRDPRDLLRHGHIGMTDFVSRPTPRAAELADDEYTDGLDRLARLCRWLQPRAVAIVGLAGWRAAVHRKAVAGWQPTGIGDVPVYVVPSTSGLNAHMRVADLAAHFTAAADGP